MILEDTDPKMEKIWFEMLDKRTIGQRVAEVLALSSFMAQLQMTGLRRDFPQASEREIFLRAAALRLGNELCKKVYGWCPEENDNAELPDHRAARTAAGGTGPA
jgi:hypothetical protein